MVCVQTIHTVVTVIRILAHTHHHPQAMGDVGKIELECRFQ